MPAFAACWGKMLAFVKPGTVLTSRRWGTPSLKMYSLLLILLILELCILFWQVLLLVLLCPHQFLQVWFLVRFSVKSPKICPTLPKIAWKWPETPLYRLGMALHGEQVLSSSWCGRTGFRPGAAGTDHRCPAVSSFSVRCTQFLFVCAWC